MGPSYLARKARVDDAILMSRAKEGGCTTFGTETWTAEFCVGEIHAYVRRRKPLGILFLLSFLSIDRLGG
jgi:hypothetical protein